MLVKVFSSKGLLNGVHGKLRHRGRQYYTIQWTQSLEEEINRWLAQNPAITISQIQQSSTSIWFGRHQFVVTVWYEPPKTILTREAAQGLVLEYVSNPESRDDIAITEVIERPFGWVFYYNSKRYAETGDDKYQLLGNYPILVDRHTCTLHQTGLGKIEDCIATYEKTGHTGA
jgi:hypothetical protein